MIKPLADLPIPSKIAALPKADLHIHQEEVARLERVVARQQGRTAYNWRKSAQRLVDENALEEGAADGAVLIEIRFGAGSMAFVQPDFMDLFREAERQAQQRYPQLRAEAIGYIGIMGNPDKQLGATSGSAGPRGLRCDG